MLRIICDGSGVGGTWYWNRYPGARFDSESYSYQYTFSKELLAEWHWTEHFSPQPETEKYCNYVADKFDLKRDVRFGERVTAATYIDEPTSGWEVRFKPEKNSAGTEEKVLKSKFLITAIGVLSTPTMPLYEGIEDFKGEWFHTARWPKYPVTFDGKRVAVLGTGATGVQTIQEVVKTAGTLTVFQRTPNWCAPLHNGKIDKTEMAAIRQRYDEIFKKCSESYACFMHTTDARGTFEVSDEERNGFWEELYASPGFGIWMGNFKDVLKDKEANNLLSDFVAEKIRGRVKNPEVAEQLIPRNHGFGTRRVPLETKYYEVYNQPNVELVDLKRTPVERVTEKGFLMGGEDGMKEREFDMIIYATGFDAVTGSFGKIDFTGKDGQKLKSKWTGGPKTYLGMMVEGFPNMMMLMGPHTALGNIPRSIEYSVDWEADLIHYMTDKGLKRVEATAAGCESWTEHVKACSKGLLANDVDSWMTGVNSNVEGKQTRIIARYSGSGPDFRKRCDDVAKDDYRELELA